MRHSTAAVLALLALAPGAAQAAGVDRWAVRQDGRVLFLRTWSPARDPTLAAGLAALGRATSCRDLGDGRAEVVWGRAGVRATFEAPPGVRPTRPCRSPRVVRTADVELHDRRWHTRAGLHPGDPFARVERLYGRHGPLLAAERAPGRFLLTPRWLAARQEPRLRYFGPLYVEDGGPSAGVVLHLLSAPAPAH